MRFGNTDDSGLFNARTKFYPSPDNNGEWRAVETRLCSIPVYNPLHVDVPHSVKYTDDGTPFSRLCRELQPERYEENKNICSFRRARVKAYDYMMCNPDMNMFVTLTIDGDQINRESYDDIIKRLNVWLDNRVRRRGLKYLLVPEFHADGKAVHFHGLMNEAAIDLTATIHRRCGKVVYNLRDFPYGFTTAIRRGKSDADITRTSRYIWKYITKGGGLKVGGRYYLHGGALVAPRYTYGNIENVAQYAAELPDCVFYPDVGGYYVCLGEKYAPNFTFSGLSPVFTGDGQLDEV